MECKELRFKLKTRWREEIADLTFKQKTYWILIIIGVVYYYVYHVVKFIFK